MKTKSDGSGQAVQLAETSRSQGVPAPFSPPEWSPAGDWIAFGDEWNQLTLISPDGRARRRLGGTGPAAWSRDGRTLYQVCYEDHALVAIDITSG